MENKNLSSEIDSEFHVSEIDSTLVNQASVTANVDRDFILKAIKELEKMDFPAYKNQILEFLSNSAGDAKLIALFQTLSASIKYRDLYQVQKALEQNNSQAKQENQISDKTRLNLNTNKVDPNQKRKDYPEVPATAMKTYICQFCGKDFQTRDDLIHHQEFEFKKKEKSL
jgi:hypothetical protein